MYRLSTDSITPIPIAPANVSQNERNEPTSAAASARSTVNASAATLRNRIGATKIPARPASAPPAAQLTMAILSGE